MAFVIGFSGLRIRLIPPAAPMELPDEFLSLLTHESGPVDAEYEVQLLEKPLLPGSEPVHCYNGISLYQTDEGWLRIYPLRGSEEGCRVACLLRSNQKHILYYPAALWDHYTRPLHCAHLMGLEAVLLDANAFLLHSSVVLMNGKAVLFCGPSGAGKSTQAELWHRYLGAQILNGDRCVVMEKADGFYGGGSPLAGSSNIYRPEQAPIAAIILPQKAAENRIERLGFEAFPLLLSQTLLNSWDQAFMHRLTDLYQNLLSQIPIYRLHCRPDEAAVQLAYETTIKV